MNETDVTAQWLKPKQNRVVIRRDKHEDKRPGRLIQEVKRQKPQQGLVLSIGPDVKDRTLVGQTVLFLEWSGQDAPGLSGEEYITMSEDEVICEVDKELLRRLDEEQVARNAAEREAIRRESLARSNAALAEPAVDPDPLVSVGELQPGASESACETPATGAIKITAY